MHATEGALEAIERDVDLRNDRIQAVRFELLLAESAREEPAVIFLGLEIDHEGAFQRGFRKNHNFCLRLCPHLASPARRERHPWQLLPAAPVHPASSTRLE
jgi:hypothetical protein